MENMITAIYCTRSCTRAISYYYRISKFFQTYFEIMFKSITLLVNRTTRTVVAFHFDEEKELSVLQRAFIFFFFLKTLLRGANKIDPKAHETSVYRLIIRCTDVEFEIFHIFIYFLFRVSVFACADYILKNARHFKSRNNCNGIDWILNLNLPNNTAQTFFVCNYSSLPRSRRTKRSILSRFPTYSRAVSYIFFFLFSFFSARSTDMRLRFFVLTRVNIPIDKWDNNNTVNVSRLN